MEYVKPECRSAEKGGRVTLKDIAREANVSHTVVSHILSNKAEKLRVSPATQKRVMDIARRLNYRPSFAGRGLVSRKTLQIGLFTPFGNFNAMPRILSSVQEVCTQHDYAILHFSYAGGEAEKQCIDRCLYRDVDGIIAVPYFENPDRNNIDLYRQLRDQGIPLVEVCGNYITDVPAVRPDGRKGCRLSLEHLYELGHREAALFTHHRYRAFAGSYAHPDAEEQYKCCVDICERLGMRFEVVTHQLPDRSEKELPYFAERFYASAERAALEWLSRSHRPKAVVCYNEFQALAMVNAAHQANQVGAAWFASVLHHLVKADVEIAQTWHSRGGGTFGLFSDNNEPRPAARFFAIANRCIRGRYLKSATSSPDVECLAFRNPEKFGVLLINKSGRETDVKLDLLNAPATTPDPILPSVESIALREGEVKRGMIPEFPPAVTLQPYEVRLLML